MNAGETIQDRIRAGRLPAAAGYRLNAGKGDGSVCACCDRFITSGHIQFDVECPLPRGDWMSLAMHIDCFQAWRSESHLMAQQATAVARQWHNDQP